ncbi:MAG: hypothetical protein IPF73_06805 [Betaproteobacteria bacterium]|nr:hypothetical protein [Betaproteobacteria bacterium]
MSNSLSRFLFPAVTALGLSACSSWPGPAVSWEPLAAGAERTLEAHRWRLESATDAQGRRIDGVALPGGLAFTFAFPSSRVVIDGVATRCAAASRSTPAGSGSAAWRRR